MNLQVYACTFSLTPHTGQPHRLQATKHLSHWSMGEMAEYLAIWISYGGPYRYRVTWLTPANVFIRMTNDPNGEVLDVSIQWVPKCSEKLFSSATSWIGHGSRKRC